MGERISVNILVNTLSPIKPQISVTRCLMPFARCQLTRKLMFGRKCTKLVYRRVGYSSIIYVDTDRYAYEVMTQDKMSDIPLPPSFGALGRIRKTQKLIY